MNPVRMFTLLGLAVIVVAFATTWLTIPTGHSESVSAPASFFIGHLGSTKCLEYSTSGAAGDSPGSAFSQVARIVPFPSCLRYARRSEGVTLDRADLATLRTRVKVIYGSTAAVVLLVGLALSGHVP